MDAVVRATSKVEDVVVCPLLEANGEAVINVPTVTEVEQHIRMVLAEKHQGVQVDRVAVHYQNATSVHVDVNMNCRGENSLSNVQRTADAVRDTIRASRDYIDQAHIFLDLNEGENTVLPSNTRANIPYAM